MLYRTIGKTGVKVSEIGFGCGNNAVLMVKASYQEQRAAVRHALDCGINYFDTAFAYGLGKSEENLGRILKDLDASVVVSTKIRLEPDGLSDLKAATIAAVEAGLERLNRDRVDFIQLHTRVTKEHGSGKRFSLTAGDVLAAGGVIDGFKAMRDRRKVGFFGFSGLGDPESLHELVESGEFHAFQAYYNLLNPSAGHRVPAGFSALDYRLIIDKAAARGMGAFVIRVLAAGALTSTPDAGGGSSPEPLSLGSDYGLDRKRAEIVRSALNIPEGQLTATAIRFALMKPEVSTVLVGFSNAAHIDEAVRCSGAPELTADLITKLKVLWENDFKDPDKNLSRA
jgi:aryl-alcohol dehydrogenase-like predicted oxidoreductase